MTRWYRAYSGTLRDDKLAEAAVIAGCSRSIIIATWHGILESAAEAASGGRFDTTPRRIAATLGESAATIESAFSAMQEIGLIGGGTIPAWGKRQYESDNSTERSRKHRETKRNGDATLQNSDATAMQRFATPPETETETETEDATSVASSAARLDYNLIEAECRKAASAESNPSPSLSDVSPIVRCLNAGADLQTHVLPVLREITARKHNWRVWSYAERAIMDRKASFETKAPDGHSTGPPAISSRTPTAAEQAAKLRIIITEAENVADREREANRTSFSQLATSQAYR